MVRPRTNGGAITRDWWYDHVVRDRFITGQEHRALRRHLDSVGPDTPISDIVDRCRVWESHEERHSRPAAGHEPTGPRGVFQVKQQISDEHSGKSTVPDKTYSETEYWPNGCEK